MKRFIPPQIAVVNQLNPKASLHLILANELSITISKKNIKSVIITAIAQLNVAA
jgi:hypothetical protein